MDLQHHPHAGVNGGSLLDRLARDWRLRTLVPVIVIHVVGFLGLSLFIYTMATRGIVGDYQKVAQVVLEEADAYFNDSMTEHRATELFRLIDRHNASRRVTFGICNREGTLVAGQLPSFLGPQAIQQLLHRGEAGGMAWLTVTEPEAWLTGVRVLRNGPACQTCHAKNTPILGYVLMSQNISEPLSDAKKRVRTAIASIALVWFLLLLVMHRLKTLVIARPLAQMQRTLGQASAQQQLPFQDLDAMARQVQETIWQLLRRAREEREVITASMARVEQLACLGEIAAGLTHEIRNPLAAIMAALETILEEPGMGTLPQRTVLVQMHKELKRVHSTLDRLLSLARPPQPHRVPVELEKLLVEVSTLFTPRAHRRKIQFSLEVDKPLPTVRADPNLLTQAFMNLLTNAFQAVAPNGKVWLKATPFPQRDGVAVIVEDDGPGIPPENLPRIFDPFFTTKEGGTGLGLPIVRQIVTQHGGEVTVDSQPGAGTRVLVLLPCEGRPANGKNHGSSAAG